VKGRYLIVNADDYGLSPGVNRGIETGHEDGIVTSASVMVLQPAAEAAAEYGRMHRDLGLGLHIDLGEWVHDDCGWRARYERVDTDDPAATRLEVERQLACFFDLVGRKPTHLDSHQHVHRKPVVGAVCRTVAQQLEIPLRHESDVHYCGEFYGQSETGEPDHDRISIDALNALIAGFRQHVTELACHPAADVDIATTYATERLVELSTLCDERVRQTVERIGIALVKFEDVA
jgi:predicted glycoside hydrolase/deacetylase ChbG (UPF0249 family)